MDRLRTPFSPKALRRLLASRNLFDIIMDNFPNWVFVKDEEFRIIYANRSFLELYAPDKREHILGTTTLEDFTEEEKFVFLQEDRKAFETGFTEIVEELQDYKGATKTVLTQKIRFEDDHGKPLILGICTDITQMALRERELAQSNMALENFAALAAHDLRSPLGTFISGIELIKLDKETKLSPASLEYLDLMRNGARNLVDQISGLLSTYKASHEHATVRSEVDLNMVLEEVKFNLSSIIKDADAHITSTRLPMVRVDKSLFRQLFHNLIENSIKYRSGDKPVIIVRCEVEPQNFKFSVEDNGVGVKDQAGNIFSLYERKKSTDIDGYGIGLSLCKKIIELHEGKIWIDPEYKQGFRISFTVPK